MIVYVNLSRRRQGMSGPEQQVRRKMPGKVEFLYTLSELHNQMQSSDTVRSVLIEADPFSPIDGLLQYQKALKQSDILLILHNITSDQQIAGLLKLYPRYITFDGEIDIDKIVSLLKNRGPSSAPAYVRRQRHPPSPPVRRKQPSTGNK